MREEIIYTPDMGPHLGETQLAKLFSRKFELITFLPKKDYIYLKINSIFYFLT